MEWINISERTPELNKFVLIANQYGIVKVARTFAQNVYIDEYQNEVHHITHWMNLPDNPNKK
jgi:hypothetical protein